MDISREWTQAERAALVATLRGQLDSCTDGKAFDIAERIRFLKTMPATFLEANRDCIINGNVIPEKEARDE